MNVVSVASLPLRQSGASTAIMFTFASMSSVQIGAAASTSLFAAVGPGGTAWLRVSWAAVGFVLLARPRLRDFPRRHLATAAALGVVSAAMTLLFFEAIYRIPLATSVSIEFLGPLAVAVWRRRGKLGLLWPVLGLAGVLAMTRPWQGQVDPIGLACALGAAFCWAGYILLMQRVGDRFEGINGLAISMPAGAVVTAIVGMPQALGHLSMSVIVIAGGLALLLPMIPYALELLALRRLNTAAFGTLMCAEPALALLAGAVMLHQIPDWGQLLGIAVVCVAGVGAVRTGSEREDDEAAEAAVKAVPEPTRARSRIDRARRSTKRRGRSAVRRIRARVRPRRRLNRARATAARCRRGYAGIRLVFRERMRFGRRAGSGEAVAGPNRETESTAAGRRRLPGSPVTHMRHRD